MISGNLSYAHKLEPCSHWDKSQTTLFFYANFILAVSLIIPHHIFNCSIVIGRSLMTVAYSLFCLWGGFHLCAPDVFAWNFVFVCLSLVHVIVWCWRCRPGRIRCRLLMDLYQGLFMPVGISQELFMQLTHRSIIHELKIGEEYFHLIPPTITRTLDSTTSTTMAIHPMRLSILLTGKYVTQYLAYYTSISMSDLYSLFSRKI